MHERIYAGQALPKKLDPNSHVVCTLFDLNINKKVGLLYMNINTCFLYDWEPLS